MTLNALPPQGDCYDWMELLKLSEQLGKLTSQLSQHSLIISTVERLTTSKVSLWFSFDAFHLPGSDVTEYYFPPDNELVNRALKLRKTIRVESKAEVQGSSPYILGIPLLTENEIIGVMQVERSTEHPFTENDIRFLEALATHTAAAMQLSQQIAIKNWRFEQLALVRSVSFQIAHVLDLDELARRVTRLILHTFQFYYVAIITIEKNQETLNFRASARFIDNKDSGYLPQAYIVHMGEGIVGYVAETGQEFLASDVRQEPQFRYVDSLAEAQSEIALPLKVENKILGVLDVQSDRLDAFHEMDIMVLRALADNIALAIEGARLYGSARRKADQISTVAEVSRAITSILDLEALLPEIVDVIQKRFGYPFVHLFTIQPVQRKIVFQAGSGLRSESMKAMGVSYDIDNPLGIIPWVARNGKSVLANDVSKDERYQPSLFSTGETNSELTLPLIFGDEILGILDIQSDKKNVFDNDDLFLFEALSSNIAISLRNATLYHTESWRQQISESLRDVASLISTNVDLNQVLDFIISELEDNLSCDAAAIWLSDEDIRKDEPGKNFHVAAVHGCDLEVLERIQEEFPESESWYSKVVQEEAPVIRTIDDPKDPVGIAMNLSDDYSSIAIALRANGHIVGVLVLVQEMPNQYGIESSEITATIAGYAAIAIENNRLYTSAQEQAWISTLLLQVTEAVQSLTTIDDLIQAIVRLTALLAGIKGCSIFLWDENINEFVLNTSYGKTPTQNLQTGDNALSIQNSPAFTRLVSERAAVIIHNPGSELFLPENETAAYENMLLVLLPLETRQNFLGAFLLTYDLVNFNPTNSPAREEEQITIIQGITQQTAVAVENIRLIEARQEEAYVTAVLLQVAQSIASSNNLDDILESIVNTMPILIGIDMCIIYLFDQTTNRFEVNYVHSGTSSIDEQLRASKYLPGEFPILDCIWQTETPKFINFEDNNFSPVGWRYISQLSDNCEEEEVLNKHAGVIMGFPLMVKDDHYGVLLAAETGGETKFRAKRAEIVASIAQQASIAIQNDLLQKEMVGRERLEREIQLAREIQQTFLPSSLPNLPGWEIDVSWKPARQVGGDFYDLFELPDKHLGLVIADVSDKGMPAALYMAVTRTLIRSTIPDLKSPARVLEHVNDLLLINSQNGLFVTAFYGILNVETGNLTYASAGHNQPLYLDSLKGRVQRLARGGAALGMLGNPIHLTDHHLEFNVNDSLVFFTDGAIEAFSPEGEIFGEERLRETITGAAGLSAHQIITSIDSDLVDFLQGEPPGDDTTLMVLHRILPESSNNLSDNYWIA